MGRTWTGGRSAALVATGVLAVLVSLTLAPSVVGLSVAIAQSVGLTTRAGEMEPALAGTLAGATAMQAATGGASARMPDADSGPLGSLITTLAACSGIALLATAFAWPWAWVVGRASRHRALVCGLVCVPLVLPSFIIYTGLSALRGPGTFLGGVLERGPAQLNLAAGQGLALVSVALWLAPVPTFVLGQAIGLLPAESLDLLRLEPLPWRRGGSLWARIRMLRGALVAAFVTSQLLAIGSAVPLHLAQLNTFSIRLWRVMDVSASPVPVLRAAWPTLLPALGAAWLVTSRLLGGGDDSGGTLTGPDGAQARRGDTSLVACRVAGAAIWALAVLLPIAGLCQAMGRRAPALITAFWRDTSEAVAQSAGVALGVGIVGVALTLATWCALGAATRPSPLVRVLVRTALTALTITLVLPGVVIGWASRAGWSALPESIDDALGQSAFALVAAHASRFGCVAVATGVILARRQPAWLLDSRRSEGAEGLGAWLTLCLRADPGTPIAAGLAMAGLSLMEIESGVMVQPPGSLSLARTLLEHLHTLRDGQLAAGAVSLAGGAIVLALVCGWLVARASPAAGVQAKQTDA